MSNNKKILNINTNLFLFIKIETTGFPITNTGSVYKYYPHTELDKYNSSRIVRISWSTYNFKKENKSLHNHVILPNGYTITNSNIHGITNQHAINNGININTVFDHLENDIKNVKFIVGHSLDFIVNILLSELYRANRNPIIDKINNMDHICTAESTINILKLPAMKGKYKMPSFADLYAHCNNYEEFDGKKNDGETYIKALMECFFKVAKINS